jgi:hypothetical protein
MIPVSVREAEDQAETNQCEADCVDDHARAESGTAVTAICPEMGVSELTVYR